MSSGDEAFSLVCGGNRVTPMANHVLPLSPANNKKINLQTVVELYLDSYGRQVVLVSGSWLVEFGFSMATEPFLVLVTRNLYCTTRVKYVPK